MPFKEAMSLDHHSGDLTLRSSQMMVNWDFEKSILQSRSSKPEEKDSNSEVLWLGNLYTTANHFLFSVVTSQTRYSVKDGLFTRHTTKDSF